MKAQRTMIAMRTERVAQLQLMAQANGMPTSDFLELLIAKQAKKEQVKLPGVIVDARNGKVIFELRSLCDGDGLPPTTLEPAEARELANCLETVATDTSPSSMTAHANANDVAFWVDKKSVAIRLDTLPAKGESSPKNNEFAYGEGNGSVAEGGGEEGRKW